MGSLINLKVRTEYSFGLVYGPLPRVLAAVGDAPQIGIADRHGTWGHVAFEAACREVKKTPIYGAELAVVQTLEREKMPINYMTFIARSNAGLQELYELVSESTQGQNFYYHPRLTYSRIKSIGQDIIVLSGTVPVWSLLNGKQKNLFVELAPNSYAAAVDWARESKRQLVAVSDNYYPAAMDRSVYEILAGRNRDSKTTPMHILDEWGWQALWPGQGKAITLAARLAAECNVDLPKAKLVKFNSKKTLKQLCTEAAPRRGINLKDPVYAARLKRELDLIAEKKFEDYFFVIHDMLRYAKSHMLVGPARGSSAGSLVCYLLEITEVDPIPFGLLFERFIDINRKDLPDIDIDFQDNKREMVFDYAIAKYGHDCVARLGTILRYKAKSAIDVVATSLKIPIAEVETLKGAIIERSGGDSRAGFCILDTFDTLEVGRTMLKKYPHLRIAADLELHANTHGKHAAGIVITDEPVSKFCSYDHQHNVIMVDKHDAESINLLKIDALGLRTLSVIQDCLDQIGQSREWLLKQPLNDEKAFAVINQRHFAGIFQMEGYGLQSLCQQMRVEHFEDIVSLGALGRPGPIISGAATEFLARKTGRSRVVHLHPMCKDITNITYGVVIYQEQVMQIAREMGRLSWEDVSSLRKAMSKSLGKEFFDQYWNRFKQGAINQGVTEEDALSVWNSINSMGAWSFNRSHAVSYAMVTYWCMMLKAYHPLEWATACLRNSSDNDQCIRLLRELVNEGYEYRDFDYQESEINWSVKNGRLIGGLLNVPGVGVKKAEDIIQRRREGRPLTSAMEKLLRTAATPFKYETIFECQVRFGHIRENPIAYNIKSKIWNIDDITSDMNGTFVFFGKILKKNLRDLNEPILVLKRGGKRIEGVSPYYLICTVGDDTGTIFVAISNQDYLEMGKPIVETGQIGDWYLWKGYMRPGFRKVYIQRVWPEKRFTQSADQN